MPHFRGWRAAAITAADVRRYVAMRQGAKAANAQINRELAALRRAYVLGVEGGKVLTRPKIAMLDENNVRTGFFEREHRASASVPTSARLGRAPRCRRPPASCMPSSTPVLPV